MRDALVAVLAEDGPEGGRGGEAGLWQLDRRQGYGLLHLGGPEAEALPDPPGGSLELSRRGLLVLVAPAPVLAPARYQWTPRIRCANATASVEGSFSSSLASSPLAAFESGNSL
jgi:hypothetical protein